MSRLSHRGSSTPSSHSSCLVRPVLLFSFSEFFYGDLFFVCGLLFFQFIVSDCVGGLRFRLSAHFFLGQLAHEDGDQRGRDRDKKN